MHLVDDAVFGVDKLCPGLREPAEKQHARASAVGQGLGEPLKMFGKGVNDRHSHRDIAGRGGGETITISSSCTARFIPLGTNKAQGNTMMVCLRR